MANSKNSNTAKSVTEILKVSTGTVTCYLLGTSPLIMNRLSEKVQFELLMPRGRKTDAERATTLKHDPYAEYRASVHRISDPKQPLLGLPTLAFKSAIRTAALDMPGAKKAQIGRLTQVNGEYFGVYGVPRLFMRPTRSADMNRTPDIRTRAILKEWACVVTFEYVRPLITSQAVTNLLAAAGITIGVGDWRSEKGSGSYGQFRIVAPSDATWKKIVKNGGRVAQQRALEHPVCYDDESTELLSWFDAELAQRKLKGTAAAAAKEEAA